MFVGASNDSICSRKKKNEGGMRGKSAAWTFYGKSSILLKTSVPKKALSFVEYDSSWSVLGQNCNLSFWKKSPYISQWASPSFQHSIETRILIYVDLTLPRNVLSVPIPLFTRLSLCIKVWYFRIPFQINCRASAEQVQLGPIYLLYISLASQSFLLSC